MENRTVIDRIRMVYENTGLSKKMFAETIGMSETGFRKLLDNGRVPQNTTIQRLLQAYPHVSQEWLLKGTGELKTNVIHNETKPSEWADKLLQKLEVEIAKKDEEIQRLWNHVNLLVEKLGKLNPSKNISLGQEVRLRAA